MKTVCNIVRALIVPGMLACAMGAVSAQETGDHEDWALGRAGEAARRAFARQTHGNELERYAASADLMEVELAAGAPETDAANAVTAGEHRMIGWSGFGPPTLTGMVCALPFNNDTDDLIRAYWSTSDVLLGEAQARSNRAFGEYALRYNQALASDPRWLFGDICRPADEDEQTSMGVAWIRPRQPLRPGEEAEYAGWEPIRAWQTDGLALSPHQAARFGEAGLLIEALGAGLSPDEADAWNMSLLGWAVARDRREIVDILLAAGADPNLGSGANGWPPLIWAIAAGRQEVAARLLAAGASPDASEINGEFRAFEHSGVTPLAIAASVGDTAMINRLIAAGADVDALPSDTSYTALAWAAGSGDHDALVALLGAGADPDLANTFEPGRSEFPQHPLAIAARFGHSQLVTTLLAAGADIDLHDDCGSTSALHQAVSEAQSGVVAILLASGADPDVGRFERAQSTFGGSLVCNSPLMAASHVWRDNERVWEPFHALIAAGADLDEPSGYMEAAPLVELARWKQISAVRDLLEAGADPAVIDENGNSALHTALGYVYDNQRDAAPLALLDLLIEGGVPVNQANNLGQTPVFQACRPDHLERLIAAGAETSHRDRFGRTPLFRARQLCPDMVAIMIEAGIDPAATDRWGYEFSEYPIPEHTLEHLNQ